MGRLFLEKEKPPLGRSFLFSLLAFVGGFGFLELLVEAIDAAIVEDDALIAGVERMAVRAGVDFDVAHGRASLEDGTAGGAGNGRVLVRRMDAFLHFPNSFRRTAYCRTESHITIHAKGGGYKK